jgi:hypothetical protein
MSGMCCSLLAIALPRGFVASIRLTLADAVRPIIVAVLIPYPIRHARHGGQGEGNHP